MRQLTDVVVATPTRKDTLYLVLRYVIFEVRTSLDVTNP